MGFREVSVIEVREVLRGWLDGAGLRLIAERAGVDRKTARRYMQAAQAAGLDRSAGSPRSMTSWSGRWWPRSARPVEGPSGSIAALASPPRRRRALSRL